ncbi:zinc-finger domain-containing protein [Alphaproteobacteria bacterium]|nr:zinc-finger domain-containing protein [Alphaproteobacteria bacterium]
MEQDVIIVSANIETICCDGGQDGLGHPAVYYSFDNQEKIVCGYCGKIYTKEKE